MNKKLTAVLSVLSVISFIVLAYSIMQIEVNEIPSLLFWIFLGSLFESLPIYYAKERAVSVTFAIILAAQFSHGTSFTTLVAALSAVLVFIKNSDGSYKHLFNLPIHISLINLTNYTISMFLAGQFYHFLDKIWPSDTSLLLKIPLYILTVFFFNSTIMSIYASIMSNSPFIKIWTEGTLWALPNFIAIAPIGFFIYKLYQVEDYGFIYVLMLLGPLLLARYSFKLYLDSKEQYYKIIKTLTAAIEAKDKYTEGHSRRVEYYAELIAQKMNVPPYRIEAIKVAALLHDIGKIGIEDYILRKPGKLTDDEWEKIRQHPRIGMKILEEVSFPDEVKNAILHHHEKYNGEGYPDNLKADENTIDAYILAAADAYDAMTSDRPYRKALSKQTAIEILKKERGSQFHPKVADILITILEQEEAREEDKETEEQAEAFETPGTGKLSNAG
ncbi:MAG TPA: HD-GYP domain-containing protein [Clostridiales bacterium]|nr:HD-GYP domain-containing protein [Clostridiales bacterium]